ncbi:MAG: hypothetical protein FJ297_15575 [Planctomycetes bacterium]|nr:hypothetical protein [Planctomycetota bacterium]
MAKTISRIVAIATALATGSAWCGEPDAAPADWPRWRGADGIGSWHAPAWPEDWPGNHVRTMWSRPIGPGFSGIAVADGNAFTMDRDSAGGRERVLCHDARTGEPRWEYAYDAAYGDLDYGKGPRSTPLVADRRVITIGAVGHVACLDVNSGHVLWTRHAVTDWGGRQPTWGFSASPVPHEDKLIFHIGGADACFIAVRPDSGAVVWRSGNDPCGYATPIVVRHAEHDLLVSWTPEHIVGIDCGSGRLLWEIPYKVTYGVSIASPVFADGTVFVSGYWEGTKTVRLGPEREDATLLWEDTRHVRGLMAQPLYRDGLVYLLDRQHGIVCCELESGRIVWTDQHQLTPANRNPHASIVWAGEDRLFALNSEGELVLAALSPTGLTELGRTKILGSTWAHPAFCGEIVIARDDERLVGVRIVP